MSEIVYKSGTASNDGIGCTIIEKEKTYAKSFCICWPLYNLCQKLRLELGENTGLAKKMVAVSLLVTKRNDPDLGRVVLILSAKEYIGNDIAFIPSDLQIVCG